MLFKLRQDRRAGRWRGPRPFFTAKDFELSSMFTSRSLSPQEWLKEEVRSIEAELDPPFHIQMPARQLVPIVFNSPHSGRVYPSAFVSLSRLDATMLRLSEDCYVEELFAPVVDMGAPLMHARFPRAYLDVNRQPYELDPNLITDPLPDYANRTSLRAIGGLGTVPRLVNEHEQIYSAPLPLAVALERIHRLYHPYHAALSGLIAQTLERFGQAILIDCHSMPSQNGDHGGAPRADFVLGDRFGQSCSAPLTDFIERSLRGMGYHVVRNKPYAGGHITDSYGRPDDNVQALQIEVRRDLYMCEHTLARTPGFLRLRRDLYVLVRALCAWVRAMPGPSRLAAE